MTRSLPDPLKCCDDECVEEHGEEPTQLFCITIQHRPKNGTP